MFLNQWKKAPAVPFVTHLRVDRMRYADNGLKNYCLLFTVLQEAINITRIEVHCSFKPW